MLRSWPRQLCRRLLGVRNRSQSTTRKPRTARLSIEALEARLVPAVSVLNHFDGLIGGDPPDACGAAGPSSYLETHNTSVAIYGKNGSVLAAQVDLNDFLFTRGGLKAVGALEDATMAYDEVTHQFIVGDLDKIDRGASALDIAVSKTANPTTLTRADWNFYQITMTEANTDADYPGNMGYNADAFVFTFNMAPTGTTGAYHVEVAALSQRSLAAEGTTLTSNRFDMAGASMRPVTMHDSAAGDSMWFVSEGGRINNQQMITLTSVSGILSSSPFVGSFNRAVGSYEIVNAPRNPDNSTITTNIDTRILKAAEANHTIVACQHVGIGTTEDDVRWYAFDVSDPSNPCLTQQGNVSAGNNTYLVYPGIDINSAGDIAMSYIRSGTDSTNDFMSVYLTGRNGADAGGTMETPVLVKAGNFKGFDRAGDFSGINVAADGSFWSINEYTTGNQEATEIARFVCGRGPVAYDQSYATSAGHELDVASPGLQAHDFDPGHNAMTTGLEMPPAYGTMTHFNGDGSFGYMPEVGFVGTDSFTYAEFDAVGHSDVATVTINVTANALTASNFSYRVLANRAFTTERDDLVNYAGLDPNGRVPSVQLGSVHVAHGTLSLSPLGWFTYTPNPGFRGIDQFTYRITDGAATSAEGTVTLIVGQPPVAANLYYEVTAGDTLRVSAADGLVAANGDTGGVAHLSGPGLARLTLSADGSFTFKARKADADSTVTFHYYVTNPDGTSGIGTVTITVDAPDIIVWGPGHHQPY